jgi:hypothetical protein
MDLKFRVGDKVIGNEEADHIYSTTRKGTKWFVAQDGSRHPKGKITLTRISEENQELINDVISGKTYYPYISGWDVNPECFDLLVPVNANNASMLERLPSVNTFR